MTYSYAHQWAGGEPRARKGRHCKPAGWAFSRGQHGHHRAGLRDDIEDLIAWRRMQGGPFGFGGPGGPFGGPGGRGRGRGRARRGDVRLALLRLLSDHPANGYQLMQRIEEETQGRWRPSPGSVYPTLSQLEDEGLIRSVDEGGARRYELTDAGREHLESRAGDPDPFKSDEEQGWGPLTELGPLVVQIGKAVWQVASVGDEAQRARAIELLAETRRALYRILADEPESGDEDPEGPIAD